MATAPISLVKSGQVGRAVLENLVQNTQGAQELLEATKRVSECDPDLGPQPEGSTPLKTMKQTFMAETQKSEVIEAFDPLRRPQGPSQLKVRESLDIYDEEVITGTSLGKFVLPSGTLQQVSGMTNTKNLMFSFFGDLPNSAMTNLWYDKTAGAFVVKTAGIVHFSGQLNLALLPAVVSGITAGAGDAINPLPYQNPTFLGTRGSNETEYRLSYHHYTAEQSSSAIPDNFRTDTLFEGKFTHYDAAKMTEKRHGFTFLLRCNAGDRIHFMLERGRSIVNYAGEQDLIRCVRDLSVAGRNPGEIDFDFLPNRITAVFLTD